MDNTLHTNRNQSENLLNKLIGDNLRLKYYQLKKLNNAKRIKDVKLALKFKAPHRCIYGITDEINECSELIKKYFIHSKGNNEEVILLGHKNIYSAKQFKKYLAEEDFLLAFLILDFALIMEIIEINNDQIGDELNNILTDSVCALNTLRIAWLKNIINEGKTDEYINKYTKNYLHESIIEINNKDKSEKLYIIGHTNTVEMPNAAIYTYVDIPSMRRKVLTIDMEIISNELNITDEEIADQMSNYVRRQD